MYVYENFTSFCVIIMPFLFILELRREDVSTEVSSWVLSLVDIHWLQPASAESEELVKVKFH